MIRLNYKRWVIIMFNLTEGQTLEEYLQSVKKSFESGEIVFVLNRGLNSDISINGIESIDRGYVQSVENIVMGYLRNRWVDSRLLTPITEYLTIKSPSEVYRKQYLGYIDDSFFYNALESSFYATVLGNDTIRGRFGVAWELWKNRLPIGNAGKSEKLNTDLPYFLTYYGRRMLLVNPIMGRVWSLDIKGTLGSFYRITGFDIRAEGGYTFWSVKVEDEKSSIKGGHSGKWVDIIRKAFGEEHELLVPYKLNEHNKRRSNKGDNTDWRTVDLDHTVDGHNRTIRVHNLVALLVYGLEAVKYTIMESNSILTIDHKNGVYNDNKVDNLQLLTRKCNEDKKNGKEYEYYDYFDLFMNRVPKARKLQDDLNFRRNAA